MKNTYFKTLVALLLCFFAGRQSFAQPASSYDYTNGSLPASYLSGGTRLTGIEKDDEWVTGIPIGFTFNFCGTDYTQLSAGSNGWLSFSTALTSDAPTNSSANLSLIRPALFPLWDDVSGLGGTSSFRVLGTAPDRVFVIEFRNWKWNYSATAGITFQVFLFEGSNVVQYRYIQESGAVKSGSASIGIADGSGTFLSINTSVAASSTIFSTNIGGKPGTGWVFQFAPQLCTTPVPGATLAAPAALICLGEYTNLSIATPPSAVKMGNSYQWQSSPDNITYTNIAGATALTYKVAPAGTTWYRCQVTCSFGPSTVASTPVQVSLAGTAPTATNGTRCGFGSVALSASGGTSVDTLRWYETPLGGLPVAMGSPFITPDLTATTDYYVAREVTSKDTVTIGTGANTSIAGDRNSPFDNAIGANKRQYLFKASELTAMGLQPGDITSVAFDVVSGGALYEGFNLSIGTTSATALTTASVGS